jgi:hypothetical protein
MHQIEDRGASSSSYRTPDRCGGVSPQAQPQIRRSESRQVPLIGKPIHFTGGQFSGRTVRIELQEIQQATLGRKYVSHNVLCPSGCNIFNIVLKNRYATIDRRPIDPPPVVLMKLFDIYNAGTDDEIEEEFEHYGYVCDVNI